MHQFHDRITPARAISPVSVADNTAQVSAIVDTLGFAGVEFIIHVGSIAAAAPTFAVTVEDGDAANLSDAAAVPATRLAGTLAAAGFAKADADSMKRIGIVDITKRYARLTITPASNDAAALISAGAILFAGRVR